MPKSICILDPAKLDRINYMYVATDDCELMENNGQTNVLVLSMLNCYLQGWLNTVTSWYDN